MKSDERRGNDGGGIEWWRVRGEGGMESKGGGE